MQTVFGQRRTAFLQGVYAFSRRARLFLFIENVFSMKEGRKMNKKILSAVLALLMCLALTLSLCACTGENTEPTQASEKTATVDEVTEPEIDPVW